MGHFWPILGHLGPFMVTFWPSRVILDLDVALGHSRRVFFFFFVANIAFTRFFCRECRDYVLFGVEFWQKFLEILRILAEILRKKSTTGVSAWNPCLDGNISVLPGYGRVPKKNPENCALMIKPPRTPPRLLFFLPIIFLLKTNHWCVKHTWSHLLGVLEWSYVVPSVNTLSND